jgi:anti-sigma factor RsiW
MSGREDDGRPVSEEELHAYIDGHLDRERHRVVRRWLAQRPKEEARLRGWAEDAASLRESLAEITREPIPARLNLRELQGSGKGIHQWRTAAGMVLALGIGSAGGWIAHGGMAPAGIAMVGQEAAAAYKVYAADPSHAVELGAADRAELVRWTTRQLGRPVAPPDLSSSGLRFLGGRVLPTQHGPGAMFLYGGSDGTRAALFVRPMHGRDLEAKMRAIDAPSTLGFIWATDGLGYGLVSGSDGAHLHALSDTVRDQLAHS